MSAIIIGNRYELMEKIGSGGMAVVYKARCRLLNRFVAIKMLRPEYNEDIEFLKRFETEAQAAASLSHTNIVSVYDVGTHDKIHYIVMECAEGVTLKKYMADKGSLTQEEVFDFSLQIASALEHAHSKGIVHHDIKPHNIMVGPDRILKVTDFGLARAVSGNTNVVGNSAIGSVHYASPEQSRGGFTDEKSDIYSLGVTMYEMATGRVPFDGETPVAVAMKHMQKTPPRPSTFNTAINSEFEKIILRSMEKEPRDRYQKISDLISDLNRLNGLSEVEAVIGNDNSYKEDRFATRKFGAVNAEPQTNETNKVTVSGDTKDDDKPALDDNPKDVKVKSKEKQTTKKKGDNVAVVAAIFTTIAIVCVLAYIFFRLFTSGYSFGDAIVVPKLVGITYEDAEVLAEEKGFALAIETEDSDEEEGTILEQTPIDGEKIKKGGTVTIVISESEGGVVLINYVGKEYEKAIDALDTLGIKYIIEEEYNDDIELGKIIKMDPKPGVTIPKDQKVTLYVSLGKDESKKSAPDLRGKSLKEAVDILGDEDLQVGNVSSEVSDLEAGTIIRQSPIAGSSVISGASVDVVLAEKRVQQNSNNNENERTENEKPNESETEQGNDNADVGDNPEEISEDIRVD